jgi:hypothetical protein
MSENKPDNLPAPKIVDRTSLLAQLDASPARCCSARGEHASSRALGRPRPMAVLFWRLLASLGDMVSGWAYSAPAGVPL